MFFDTDAREATSLRASRVSLSKEIPARCVRSALGAPDPFVKIRAHWWAFVFPCSKHPEAIAPNPVGKPREHEWTQMAADVPRILTDRTSASTSRTRTSPDNLSLELPLGK